MLSHNYMPNPLDARVLRSRRRILDGAVDVLVRKPDISLSDLAAQLGIGRATVYRHFATRAELISTLAAQCLTETDAAMAPLAGLRGRAAIEAMLDAIMPLAARYHFLVQVWSHASEPDAEISTIYVRQLQALAVRVEQAQADGDVDATLPVDWIVNIIDRVIVVAWSMIAEHGVSADKASALCKRMLFDGISGHRSGHRRT